MSRRRVVAPLLALAFAVFGLVASPATPAAHAVTGSPPVTLPDAVSVYQGNGATVQPVNNDHDPDNEMVALCRLGTEHHRGLEVDSFGNDWNVFAKPSAKPGTYTYTYYACDYSYLTAGTITVTVQKLPTIKVSKIASRPGHLKITNPADFKVRFLWGSFKEENPDGSVLIAKHSSAVITVHRATIDWVASDRSGAIFLGSGHVTGIKVVGAAGRSPGVSLPSRLAHVWRTA